LSDRFAEQDRPQFVRQQGLNTGLTTALDKGERRSAATDGAPGASSFVREGLHMYTVNLSLSDVHHTSVSVLAGQAVDAADLNFTAVLATAVTIMLVSFALEAFFRLFRKLFFVVLIALLIGLPVAGVILNAQGR
jgi:hypothetical protein